MSRYINADALCEEFTKFVRKANNHDFEPTPNWNDAISIFHSMPTVDAIEVVHGEWVDTEIEKCKCSHCKNAYEIKAKFLYSYCPNCGAKMDKNGW